MLKEFEAFLVEQNAIALAIAVVIGAALDGVVNRMGDLDTAATRCPRCTSELTGVAGGALPAAPLPATPLPAGRP